MMDEKTYWLGKGVDISPCRADVGLSIKEHLERFLPAPHSMTPKILGIPATMVINAPQKRHWFDRMCGVYGVETPPERTTIAAFFIGAALALGSLAYVLSFYVSAHG